jgi:hypothetical protein
MVAARTTGRQAIRIHRLGRIIGGSPLRAAGLHMLIDRHAGQGQLPPGVRSCQESPTSAAFRDYFCSAALCSAATAASAAWKPIFECVPSQNGFFVEAPHRHKDTAGLPSRLISVPSTSINRIGPSTRSGPLGLAVIVTFASAISSPFGSFEQPLITIPLCHERESLYRHPDRSEAKRRDLLFLHCAADFAPNSACFGRDVSIETAILF